MKNTSKKRSYLMLIAIFTMMICLTMAFGISASASDEGAPAPEAPVEGMVQIHSVAFGGANDNGFGSHESRTPPVAPAGSVFEDNHEATLQSVDQDQDHGHVSPDAHEHHELPPEGEGTRDKRSEPGKEADEDRKIAIEERKADPISGEITIKDLEEALEQGEELGHHGRHDRHEPQGGSIRLTDDVTIVTGESKDNTVTISGGNHSIFLDTFTLTDGRTGTTDSLFTLTDGAVVTVYAKTEITEDEFGEEEETTGTIKSTIASLFTVGEGCTLNIVSGIFSVKRTDDDAIAIENEGTTNISGGTFDVYSKDYGAWGIYNDGTANVGGGTFKIYSGNNSAFGIDNYDTANIYGGTFSVASESGDAWGLYNNDGTLSVYGGKFSVSSKDGSANGIENDDVLNVYGGTFDVVSTNGEAYGIDNYETATITGGEFNAVSTEDKAYGIYNTGAIDVISNCSISATSTSGTAYGIYNSGKITAISGCESISATSTGGGAYGIGNLGTIDAISNCSVSATSTGNSSYGICNASKGTIDAISGSTITAKSTSQYASGVWNNGTIGEISGCESISAKSDSISFAAYGICNYHSIGVISGSTISAENTSKMASGIYNYGSISEISNCGISAKSTSGQATGVCNFGSVNIINSSAAAESSEADLAIYNESGTVNVVGGYYAGQLKNKGEGVISIAGGTFTADPSAYLLDGAGKWNVDTETEQGKYIVTAEKYSAVGLVGFVMTGYGKLQVALNNSDSGKVIMLQDVNESVSIKRGYNVTLDLNGCILSTDDEAEPAIRVRRNATLYVVDTNSGTTHVDYEGITGGAVIGSLKEVGNGQLILCAGMYSDDPAAYVVEGLDRLVNPWSDVCGYAVGVAVAQNAKTLDKYGYLQAAVDDSDRKAVIVLLNNAIGTVTVGEGKAITIDLNGYGLAGIYETALVVDGGKVKVVDNGETDSEGNRTGLIFGLEADAVVVESGELVIDNATVVATSYYGSDISTVVVNGGKVVLKNDTAVIGNGEYTAGLAVNGGEVYVKDSYISSAYGVTLSDGTLVLNDSYVKGTGYYGILKQSGNLYAKNSVIVADYVEEDYNCGTALHTTSGVTVLDCCELYGSDTALSVYGDSTALIKDCTINGGSYGITVWGEDAAATVVGGEIYGDCGIYVNSGVAVIRGSALEGSSYGIMNDADGIVDIADSSIKAGYIGIDNNGTATVRNCTIDVYSEGSTIGINNTGKLVVLDCDRISAETDSGTYYEQRSYGIYNTGDATISNCGTISAKAVRGPAYGIHNSGNLEISDCDYIISFAHAAYDQDGNLAAKSGRAYGVYNIGDGNAVISNCGNILTYSQNDKAFGIYNDEAVITVTGSNINAQSEDKQAYGLWNNSTAAISNSSINSISFDNDAYGVYNTGAIDGISNCDISAKSTSGNAYGITNNKGTIEGGINGCSIYVNGNHNAKGIENSSGNSIIDEINNCSIVAFCSEGSPMGIYNGYSAKIGKIGNSSIYAEGTNGKAYGVYNRGSATTEISNCSIYAESTTANAYGIDNTGTLTLDHTRVQAESSYEATGIVNAGGNLTLKNGSLVVGDNLYDVGIEMKGGNLVMNDSKVEADWAVIIDGSSIVTLNNAFIKGITYGIMCTDTASNILAKDSFIYGTGYTDEEGTFWSGTALMTDGGSLTLDGCKVFGSGTGLQLRGTTFAKVTCSKIIGGKALEVENEQYFTAKHTRFVDLDAEPIPA